MALFETLSWHSKIEAFYDDAVGLVVPDVSKIRSAFIFRSTQSSKNFLFLFVFLLDYLTLKIKA